MLVKNNPTLLLLLAKSLYNKLNKFFQQFPQTESSKMSDNFNIRISPVGNSFANLLPVTEGDALQHLARRGRGRVSSPGRSRACSPGEKQAPSLGEEHVPSPGKKQRARRRRSRRARWRRRRGALAWGRRRARSPGGGELEKGALVGARVAAARRGRAVAAPLVSMGSGKETERR
jgi:hypothetical protein